MSEEKLQISLEDRALIIKRIKEADRLQSLVNESLEMLADNLNTIDRGRKFVSPDIVGFKFSKFQAESEKLLPLISAALDRVSELNEALGPARSFFPEALAPEKKNGQGGEHVDVDADAEKAREVIDALAKALAEAESMKRDSSQVVEVEATDRVHNKLKVMDESKRAKPVKRGRGKDELATATEAIKGLLSDSDE